MTLRGSHRKGGLKRHKAHKAKVAHVRKFHAATIRGSRKFR